MNQEVDYKCESISKFPSHIESTQSMNQLLSKIDELFICCGQPATHFIEMVSSQKNQIVLKNESQSICG